MPTPFSEVLEQCISGEGRAKLHNWLTNVLLPLLDGEAEPAESLANYVILLLEANHASPEDSQYESKGSGRMGYLHDQLTDKLTEFLEGESRTFVGKLLREMKSIAGFQGRGKERHQRRESSRRRDSGGGEWAVPRGGGGGGGGGDNGDKKQQYIPAYVDEHNQHKRPRHSKWGGEDRKIPLQHKHYDSGWSRTNEYQHGGGGRGLRDHHDQGHQMVPDRGIGGSGDGDGQTRGTDIGWGGWGKPPSGPSNLKGGENGNVSKRGGEYVVEGGTNQRHRREPGGPHDISGGQMRGESPPGLGDSEDASDRRPNCRNGPGGIAGGSRMVGPGPFPGQGGMGNWGGGMMMPSHPARPPGGPRGGGWGPGGRMQMGPGPGRGYIGGGPGNSYPGMIEPWPMPPPPVGVGGRGGPGGGQGGHREMYDPLHPEMGGGVRRPRFGGSFDGGNKKMGGGPPWGWLARGVGAQGRGGGGIAGSHRHQGGGRPQYSQVLPPKKRSTIRVHWLPTVATSANLTSHFKTFGRVVKVELKTNADGIPSGIAFVQFAEPNAAKQARESPIPVLNNRFVKVTIQEWNLVDLEKLEAEEKIQQKAKVNATVEVIRMQKEKAKAVQVESLAQQKLSNIERKLNLNREMLEMLKLKSEPEEEIILQVDEKVQELEHACNLCNATLADASAKVANAVAAVDKAEADAKLLGAHVPLDKTASSSRDASKLYKSTTTTKSSGLKGGGDHTPSSIGSGRVAAASMLFARKSVDNRTTCIQVKGFPTGTEEGHLRAHFVVYGEIGNLSMQRSNDSAVIKFNTRKAAELAMRKGSAYSGGLSLEMNWIDDSAAAITGVENVETGNGVEQHEVKKDMSAPPVHDGAGAAAKWNDIEQLHHSEETVSLREEIEELNSSSGTKADIGSDEKKGSPQHLEEPRGMKQQQHESNHQEEDEEEVVVL